MSEIKNGRLGLYDAEHSKCNHIIALGFKGLNVSFPCHPFLCLTLYLLPPSVATPSFSLPFLPISDSPKVS